MVDTAAPEPIVVRAQCKKMSRPRRAMGFTRQLHPECRFPRQAVITDLWSCMRAGYPSKRDSEMLKTRFDKRVTFVPSYCQNAFSKPSFNKCVSRVKSNLIFGPILFKIVKFIFPHNLRVRNAICVAYCVVCRVVVFYILRVMWKRVFECTALNKNAFCNLENATKGYPTRRHELFIKLCIHADIDKLLARSTPVYR